MSEEENNTTEGTEEEKLVKSIEDVEPSDMPQPDPRMQWSVMGLWNELNVETTPPPKERDYISAGDIGKNYWERYQKMLGVPATNAYDNRLLRVFAAGEEVHHMMKNVFKSLGVFITSQDDSGWSVIDPLMEGATVKRLKVLGKYDVQAGGTPDIKQVQERCVERGLSPFVTSKVIALADKLVQQGGLKRLIYEVKSINSLAFWNKKGHLKEAYPWHVLQLFTYLKANHKDTGIEEGRLLYVSKDDLVVQEFPVYLNDPELERIWQEDVEKMSYYYLNKIEPPKPEFIVFNNKKRLTFQKNKTKHVINGCYEVNWEVSRSNYMTLLTGFEKKADFEQKYKAIAANMNKSLKEKYIEEKGLNVK